LLLNLKNKNEKKEIRFPELAQYQSLHEAEKNVDWVGETGAMWDTGQCWTEQLKYVKLV
jgi:hypothetical protein